VKDRYGCIIRGDTTKKEIALVFTADEYGEGAETVLNTFEMYAVKASFFLTGRYYANPENEPYLHKMRNNGHYLGAHSDGHLLYNDWTKRDSLLVTKEAFCRDLDANYKKMEAWDIKKSDARFFMPPYEWYNQTITDWTAEKGLKLVNFTPGLRTAADYTYPELGENRYLTSEWIYNQLVNFEQSNSSGLNGYMILIHLGTDPRRPDKFYNLLPSLIEELQGKGYEFKRVDALLND
jgi:endoglucanase